MRLFASLDKRRVFMTIGVLCLAFLSGHAMQSLNSNPLARIDNSNVRPLPSDPAASSLLRPPVMQGRTNVPKANRTEAASKPNRACIPQLKLKRAPGAMIDLTFNGCEAGKIAVRHGNVESTTTTDATGRLMQRIPAFDPDAHVSITFRGDTLDATLRVPDADDFQHVAIVWSGAQTLRMHAFEFGAKRNQFGHVWAGAPKSPQRAMRGNGGFLTRLGDGTGASAEVYSFPAGQSRNKGVVRLVVEADVTPENCGRQIDAVALQTGPLGGMNTTEVALKMPQCDGVGRVVRLQNLFQDMRLAGR